MFHPVSSFAMGQAKQMGVQLNLVDPQESARHPHTKILVACDWLHHKNEANVITRNRIRNLNATGGCHKPEEHECQHRGRWLLFRTSAAGPCLTTNSHRQQSSIFWVTTNPTIGTHFFFSFLRFRAWQTMRCGVWVLSFLDIL